MKKSKILFFIFISLMLVLMPFVIAYTIKDYYTPTTDTREANGASSNRWFGNAFTAGSTYTLTMVELKLSKSGTPNTVTVHIRATTGGNPSGADLCSGTTNGNLLSTTNSDATPHTNITLSAGCNLASGTVYSVFISATGGGSYVSWRSDLGSTYPITGWVYSDNAGSTWATEIGGTESFYFITYSSDAAGYTHKVNNAVPIKVNGVTPIKVNNI